MQKNIVYIIFLTNFAKIFLRVKEFFTRIIINKKRLKKMPKLKTRSAVKKRFTLTASGKLKRRHAYHSHILTKKSNKRKRNLCSFTTVSAADEKILKEMLVR